MWVLVCLAHLLIHFCFTFPLMARRSLQRQNWCRQNSSYGLSHFWIFGNVIYWLRRTVLALAESDFANCMPIFDFERFLKIFRKINKWILNSLEVEMFESQKNCLTPRRLTLRRVWLSSVLVCVESDSAQCLPAQSLTPQSVNLFF